MSVKISYKEEDGEAKGAWVEEENEGQAPEFVGLSKKQFFGFFIAAILMGAGIFGIGYTLAYFKKEHVTQAAKKKSAISLDKDAIDQSAQAGVSMVPGSSYVNYPGKSSGEGGEETPAPPSESAQGIASENANAHVTENAEEIYSARKYYVSLGMCKTEEEAKNLIDILKGLGKAGNIKGHELGYVVYLGPFVSRSQAQAEVDSIELSTSLTASVVRTLK